MNLIADIGNTSFKLALVEKGNFLRTERFHSVEEIIAFIERESLSFEKVIISSVANTGTELTDFLSERSGYIHILSAKSAFPFRINYDTPGTLGMDRLAAVAGAYNKYGNGNVLIIDAGTAITYDLLTEGRYCGGAISPGISMRFRALSTFTGRLPLVERGICSGFPARSTSDGINCGVVNGVVFEINRYICEFKEKYPEPVTILTGGDSGYISERLSAKHVNDPDLVLKGLNYILEFNAEKNA
ncbi:MAG: type III pantothenate kinase [Bacteroidales bacterium]|jgi:type III pantothenate kinase|nr:type III pantothenate kinase [Bacteroidales bacterium]